MRPEPSRLVPALLVATLAASVVATDQALAAADPSGASRRLNLILVAANLVGRALALTPLHAVLNSARDARELNDRARDGVLVAVALYAVAALAGNLLAAHAMTTLDLEPGTAAFAAATLHVRTRLVASVGTLVVDYVVVVLATMGRARRASLILVARLLAVPVSTAVITSSGPTSGALLDATVNAATLAYILVNVRHWTHEPSETRPVGWMAEYVVTGLFSGAAVLLSVTAVAALSASSESTARALTATAILIVPVAAGAEGLKLSTPNPRRVAVTWVTSVAAALALTIVARMEPNATVTSVAPGLVAAATHVVLSAAFIANGLTPCLTVSTLAWTSCALAYASLSGGTDAPGVVLVAVSVACLADVALAWASASYLSRTTAGSAEPASN